MQDADGVLVEFVEPAADSETLHTERLAPGYSEIASGHLQPIMNQESDVQHILEAILSGSATSDDFANPNCPSRTEQ